MILSSMLYNNPVSVVVSLPRSASTLMCEALEQHPDILGCGEIFIHNEDGRRYYHEKATGEQTGCFSGKLVPYLEHLDEVRRVRGKKVVTWKLMDYQEPLCWLMLMDNPSIPIIYTSRENVVEAVVSSVTCEKSGAWHAHTKGDIDKANAVTVHVDPKLIEDMWERKALIESRLARMGNPIVFVEYDDLTKKYEETVANVYRLLRTYVNEEIDIDFKPRMLQEKLHRRSLRERVENFDELVSHFRGAALARFLA